MQRDLQRFVFPAKQVNDGNAGDLFAEHLRAGGAVLAVNLQIVAKGQKSLVRVIQQQLNVILLPLQHFTLAVADMEDFPGHRQQFLILGRQQPITRQKLVSGVTGLGQIGQRPVQNRLFRFKQMVFRHLLIAPVSNLL